MSLIRDWFSWKEQRAMSAFARAFKERSIALWRDKDNTFIVGDFSAGKHDRLCFVEALLESTFGEEKALAMLAVSSRRRSGTLKGQTDERSNQQHQARDQPRHREAEGVQGQASA